MTNIKEQLKDFGSTLVGKGGEVRFKNEVKKYESRGRTPEGAQKQALKDILNDIHLEIGAQKNIEFHSNNFKKFKDALNFLFSETELHNFKTDAENPTILSLTTFPPPTFRELNEVRSYYATRHSGKAPEACILEDVVNHKKILETTMRQLVYHTGRHTADIHSLALRYKVIGAHIGKILNEYDRIQRHEVQLVRVIKHEKNIQDLKRGFNDALQETFYKTPRDFIKLLWNNKNPNLNSFINLAVGMAKISTRETAAVGTLAYRGVKSAASFINTQRGK